MMGHQLRSLNNSGIAQFESFLDGLRRGHATPVPTEMLTADEFSDLVIPSIEIGALVFDSRYDMGVYLVNQLAPLDQQRISRDTGLWSWLALLFFDQLCPVGRNGSRSPRESYTYILSRDFRHYPRHAVRTTYTLVKRFGGKVRFMFSKPLHERGEIIEQLMARQELAACPGVIEAAYILYDDPDRRTFRTGAASSGKGAARRFVRILQQFQVTYDLFSMSGEDLVRILPSEFDRFRAT